MCTRSHTRTLFLTHTLGALFHGVPNAGGGITHMINANTGTTFLLGTYDAKREVYSTHQSSPLTLTPPLTLITLPNTHPFITLPNMHSSLTLITLPNTLPFPNTHHFHNTRSSLTLTPSLILITLPNTHYTP